MYSLFYLFRGISSNEGEFKYCPKSSQNASDKLLGKNKAGDARNHSSFWDSAILDICHPPAIFSNACYLTQCLYDPKWKSFSASAEGEKSENTNNRLDKAKEGS